MKEISLNKMNYQQGLKLYSAIKLTVYGKLIKLTAAGTARGNEGKNNPFKEPKA